MKKKMTMFMVLFLLVGCALTAKNEIKPELKKETVYPANVITLPKIEILTKEVEIKEEAEETNDVKPSSSSKTQASAGLTTSHAEVPKETVAVSYSEPVPVTQKDSDSTPRNDPPAPAPEPAKEEQGPACPMGVYPELPCDAVIGDQGYSVTFSSEQEANDYGYHMLNDVMYIGDQEITNFAVQPVYVNDHSRVAFYGVELYSNGTFLQ